MAEGPQVGSSELKLKIVDIDADVVQNFQVPSYVNYVNVWHHRNDVFVDMGLVTIEQLAAFTSGTESEATVAIYDRFVMNPTTFEELFTRMNLLREQLRSQGSDTK